MSIVSDRKTHYLANKKLREDGKYIGIPIHKVFPRLGSLIPTIPPASQIMLTANSGVGKSLGWIGLILYPTYKLIKSTGIKVRFLVFLLEDPVELLIDRIYSIVLFSNFGVVADGLTLNSMRETPLPNDIIPKLEKASEIVEDVLSYCTIVDSIYNATGIYKSIRTVSNEIGVHHTKKKLFTNEDGTQYEVDVYSHYTINDPNLQVVVIVDNLNNLSIESGLTQLQSINRWTRDYGRLQVTKHWKWTVVNILQQAADSEKQQYTSQGVSIIDKVEPSLDGLANSRECQRDHLLILGLFAPNRYGFEKYYHYDIKRLGDKFRSVKILKSNISESNIRIPFYFNGASSYFKELPKVDEMSDDIYEKIKNNNIQWR